MTTITLNADRAFPEGGTPYYGLYREAPPERGILFRLQVYERVSIWLVVGKFVIWSEKGPKRANNADEFYGFIKSWKRSIFVIDSY